MISSMGEMKLCFFNDIKDCSVNQQKLIKSINVMARKLFEDL